MKWEGIEMDAYQMVLINPILKATTKQQARKRASSARTKLARHEKATRLPVGDAVDILDRIAKAETQAIAQIEAEQKARADFRT